MATSKKKPAAIRIVQAKDEASGEHKYLLGLLAMGVTALVASAPAWWLKAQLADTDVKIEAVKTAQLVSRQEIENSLLRQNAAAKDETLNKMEGLRKDIERGFGDIRGDLQDLKVRMKVAETNGKSGR